MERENIRKWGGGRILFPFCGFEKRQEAKTNKA
jgi:hypothetical protein